MHLELVSQYTYMYMFMGSSVWLSDSPTCILYSTSTCSVIWFLAGVRYFIRGVDDDGNVANYVETEQMMIYCDYRASFVQVIVHCILTLHWQFILVPGCENCKHTLDMIGKHVRLD